MSMINMEPMLTLRPTAMQCRPECLIKEDPNARWGCGVIIYNRGADRILMADRADGYGLGTPGGQVEAGETPLQAIHRETREEANVWLKDVTYYGTITHTDVYERDWLSFCFFTENYSDANLKNQVEEMGTFGWYAPDAVLKGDTHVDRCFTFLPTFIALQLAQEKGLFRESRVADVTVYPYQQEPDSAFDVAREHPMIGSSNNAYSYVKKAPIFGLPWFD